MDISNLELQGNQASLYKDMYYEEDGDLFFRGKILGTPNSDLDEAERKFVMFALKVINGNRMGLKTEEEFNNKKDFPILNPFLQFL